MHKNVSANDNERNTTHNIKQMVNLIANDIM